MNIMKMQCNLYLAVKLYQCDSVQKSHRKGKLSISINQFMALIQLYVSIIIKKCHYTILISSKVWGFIFLNKLTLLLRKDAKKLSKVTAKTFRMLNKFLFQIQGFNTDNIKKCC